MRIKKFLAVVLLGGLSIYTLSSCDKIKQFIHDNTTIPDIDINDIIDNIPSTEPEKTVDPTTINIDETIEDYGYLDLQTRANKEMLIGLYQEIDQECQTFMNSLTTLEPTEVTIDSETKNYYIIKDKISFSKYQLSYAQASSVYKCVLLDNPEYYFMANTLLNATETIGNNITKYLTLVCDESYKDATVRTSHNNKIAEYKQAVASAIGTETNVTKVIRIIHDYIINHSEYSFVGGEPDPSADAHNIIGNVVNHKGVCESYAELFHYLLREFHIRSVLVTGLAYNSPSDSGEGHAWNYAKVGDNWYGFDCTWDDPTGGTPVCTSTYFGRSKNDGFLSDHQPDLQGDFNQNINYLYTLPTLASLPLAYPIL